MRVLVVTSDGDYGALTFQQEFKGTTVIDIINNIDKIREKDEEGLLFSVREFGEVDPNFIEFVRRDVQDYDHSKHENFYLETEIVGQ